MGRGNDPTSAKAPGRCLLALLAACVILGLVPRACAVGEPQMELPAEPPMEPQGVSDIIDVTPGAPITLSPALMGPCARPSHHLCARVRVPGRSRFRHLARFAHVRRVTAGCNEPRPPGGGGWGESLFGSCALEICSHWNGTRPVGACSDGAWRAADRGGWVEATSPFYTKFVDVRVPPSSMAKIFVSVEEEFQPHRVAFLVAGMALQALAPLLSAWVPFYYSTGMAIGVVVVVLFILYQSARLLPVGRRSSWNIFVCGSVLGLGTLVLGFVTNYIRQLFDALGLDDSLVSPVVTFSLVSLFIVGAGLGFWIVRKFVLSPAGTVDPATSAFVSWSLWVVSAVMLLLSSPDVVLSLFILCLGTSLPVAARHLPWSAALSGSSRKLGALPELFQRGGSKVKEALTPSTRAAKATRKRLLGMSTPLAAGTPESIARQSFPSALYAPPGARRLRGEEVDAVASIVTARHVANLLRTPEFGEWCTQNLARLAVDVSPGAPRHEGRPDAEIALTADLEERGDDDGDGDEEGEGGVEEPSGAGAEGGVAAAGAAVASQVEL